MVINYLAASKKLTKSYQNNFMSFHPFSFSGSPSDVLKVMDASFSSEAIVQSVWLDAGQSLCCGMISEPLESMSGVEAQALTLPDASKSYLTCVAKTFSIQSFVQLLGAVEEFDADLKTVITREDADSPFTTLVVAFDKAIELSSVKTELLALSESTGVELFLQSAESYQQQYGLACFDMDSTLIQCEVIDELAKNCGIGDKVAEITERAMQGELDFKESFAERLSLLEGLSETVLEEIAVSLPVTEGLPELMTFFKQQGVKTAIFSGGFTYFAEHLQKQFGFDFICANALDIVDGKVTGKVRGEIVDATKKAELLSELTKKYDLNEQSVIAVGDGANDLLMLDKAGLGVAFWAKPLVRQQAQYALNHLGLNALIPLLK